MKIFVKAKPLSKKEKIEKIDDTHFIVSVKEPPKGGKANRAIIKALAHYFNVSSSAVNLVSGFSSKQKVFEVLIHSGTVPKMRRLESLVNYSE